MLWCQFWSVITTFYMVFTVGSNFTIVSTTITFVHNFFFSIFFLYIYCFYELRDLWWLLELSLIVYIHVFVVISWLNIQINTYIVKEIFFGHLITFSLLYYSQTDNWKKNWNRSKLLLTAFYPMNQNIIRNVRGFLKVKLFK